MQGNHSWGVNGQEAPTKLVMGPVTNAMNEILEDYDLLGFNAMYFGRGLSSLQRNILPPSSGSKSKPHNKPAIKSDKKMEGICSSEISLDF
jgi:hypothetical protein